MRWRKALSCAAERVKPTVIVLNSYADHYDLLVLLLSNRYGSAAMSLHFHLVWSCVAYGPRRVKEMAWQASGPLRCLWPSHVEGRSSMLRGSFSNETEEF